MSDDNNEELQEQIAAQAESKAKEIAKAIIEKETAGLKSKNAELLAEVKKFKGKAKSIPDDFDAEKYQKMLEDEAHRAEQKAKEAGEWDKLKEQLAQKHEERINQLIAKHEDQVKNLSGERDGMRSTLESHLVDNQVLSEIVKAEGIPELLMPIVKRSVRLHEEDGKYSVNIVDADGNSRIGDEKGSPMTIAQLLGELRESDTFSPAFKGSKATGGGAAGSNGAGSAGNKTRSKMSREEKSLFIREHGLERYENLPL